MTDTFSAYSNIAHATTPVVEAPTGLTVTPQADSFDLAWTDNGGGAATFKIERSDDGSTGWAVINTNVAGDVTYTDGGSE